VNYTELSCRRALAPVTAWASAVLMSTSALALATPTDAPTSFEAPPQQPPAVLLPESMVSGANYHVDDPVQSDGLMNHYVVESKFGRFDAYGRTRLAIRIHEVAALTELAKTSTIEVAAGGVGRGVESQLETVAGVVANPVKTVTGIPKGIAHLFHGYIDQGNETIGDAKSTAGSATGTGGRTSAVTDKTTSEVKHYAERYLGLTAAERHWYEKLRVDPYTDNAALRSAIHKNANIDAAAGFGMKFVGIPSIPGIGDVHELLYAIYNEEPATIRARNRVTLAGYGLQPGEIDRWQNTLVLNPTRQILLLKAAAALNGVEGRGELFRHALGLTSDVEAQVYLQSVFLLVLAHSKQPVVAILPGLRLPAARRADGHIVVCGAFEAVYWTADVATGEEQIRQTLLQSDSGVRELWLAGTASDRARAELRARGWDLQESVQEPATVTTVN
jgi:hypothetical protein